MSSPPAMVDPELRMILEGVLRNLPHRAIPAPLIQSLRTPTPAALQQLGEALVAAGHLTAADTLLGALLERPGVLPWMAMGRARVAMSRGDVKAAAVAWRDCLERFPNLAQPVWLCELAIAEGKLASREGVGQLLRQCADRFPRFALPVNRVVSLLEHHGPAAQSLASWGAAIRNLPHETEPGFFLTTARALEAAGLLSERAAVADEMGARFPKATAAVALRAAVAAQTDDWPRALESWNELIDRQPDTAPARWRNGRARALFRLGRIADALGAWEELLDRAPEFVPGRIERVHALRELGEYPAALRDLDDLVERFPERRRPEWLYWRAACLLEMRLDHPGVAAGLDRVIAELETDFPGSAYSRRVAILRARRTCRGLDFFASLCEEAVRRFPTDRWILSEWLLVLLPQGRHGEAEAIVEGLEAGDRDHLALIGRWHLVVNRDGGAAIADSAHRSLMRRDWKLDAALAVANFLLAFASVWVQEPVLALLESLAAEHPGQSSIHIMRARALIILRHESQALKAIDEIPGAYRTEEVLKLRAWAHARRAEHALARGAWTTILATSYVHAVHAPSPKLELVTHERRLMETHGVTVFTAIRDELPNLPWFLAHYRRLGVRRFVFVDNMSRDGSDLYLAAQPDVIVYRTRDHFREAMSGMRWINALIERHGRGGWCLFADADEAFIYPGWEQISLERLTEFLDHEGAEGVCAFILDVYPRAPVTADGRLPSHGECLYYDRDYTWIGHIRSPYGRPLGGARSRLFGTQEYLQKVPLVRSAEAVYLDSHDTLHLKLASISGAHLHYKILDLVRRAAQSAPGPINDAYLRDRALQGQRRHRRYAALMAAQAQIEFYAPGVSEVATDSLSMSERGLMKVTPEFRRWIAARD